MSNEVKELANVIYHEARGESRVGQAAVGHVVVNRVRSGKWGRTVRDVVWARGQFSGIRYHAGSVKFLELAAAILAGKVPNPVGNALYFASNRRNGRIRIGNHVFW